MPELLTFKSAWRYTSISMENIVDEDVTTSLTENGYLSVDGYYQNYSGFAYDNTALFGENDARRQDLEYIATHDKLMTKNILDKFFLNNLKQDPREAPGCRFDLGENPFNFGQLNYKNISSDGVLYRFGYNTLQPPQELKIDVNLSGI